MRSTGIIVMIMTVVFFLSCKKKKDAFIPVTAPGGSSIYPPAADFLQLKAGNYWIMEEYYVDTSGTQTKTGTTDSVYITGSENLNGNNFFGLHSSSGTIYLRTSGTHAYLDNDSLYFSTETLGDTLRRSIDSIGRTAYYMVDENLTTTVPAGTFITYTVEGRKQVTARNNAGFNPRYVQDTYGQKTGLVKKRYFVPAKPGYYEMRLLRYKVN